MKIYINQKEIEVQDNISVKELLDMQQIAIEGTAIAIDNKLVPKMNGTIGFNRWEQDNDYPGYIRRITNGFLEMKYIGITEEHPIEQENRLITALLDNGLDLIHLRKPKYSGEKQSNCYSRFLPAITIE